MNDKYLGLYVEFLRSSADVKRPMKLVADCSDGTAGLVWKALKIPNLETILIHENPDGNFPAHGPNPLAHGATDETARAVEKHNADLGVVFDSDGDRAVFVDNTGRTLPAYAAANLLFSTEAPPFVLDLPTYYTAKFIGYEKIDKVTPSSVGTRFIKKAMKEVGASAAAEFSGHYYFSREGAYFDSAILATVKLASALSRLRETLSDFYDSLPEVYVANFDLQIKGERSQALTRLESALQKDAVGKDTLDGLVLEFESWWFLARPSNTEPLIRVFLAAQDKKTLQDGSLQIKEVLKV